MTLPRSVPETEGIYSKYIINLINQFELSGIELHSLMIAKNGKVIFECFSNPYAPDIPHTIHSITKTFTNSAVAMAYNQGLIHLEDKIVDYFPDHVPADANDNLKAMTIKDLISMRCGHARGISGNEWRTVKTSWIGQFFKEPAVYEPGKVFNYSSGTSYILSAIIQKATGMTAHKYLEENFISKLGLSDFTWDLSPEGICSGGNGISLCMEDLIKVGLVYQQKGKWKGEQVIDEEWVDRAFGQLDPVERQENEPCYNFHWLDTGGVYDSYGLFGQHLIVIPSLNMVVGVYSAHMDFWFLVTQVVKEFLVEPLLLNQGTQYDRQYTDILAKKGKLLNLLQVPRSVKYHLEFEKGERIYQVDDNEDCISQISMKFGSEVITFGMVDDRGAHTVKCGLNSWLTGCSTITGNYLHHQYQPEISIIVATSYWENHDTLALEWRFPEMSFCDYIKLRFKDDQIFMERSVNVNYQGMNRPMIRGKLM